VDFFEKVRRFLRYDADAMDVLVYFALRTPGISFQITPLAVLMATLLTIGVLSRSHEITAMRSCGISLYWIASPFLFFGLVLGVVLLLFTSTIIPLSSARADYIKATHIEKKAAPLSLKSPHPWVRIGNRTLMNFRSMADGGTTLQDVRLYHLGPKFELTQITDARTARFSGKQWTLHEGTKRLFHDDGTLHVADFSTEPLPLAQIPEDFTTWFEMDTETMTFKDIRGFAARLSQDGTVVPRLMTDYYGRVAFPFVTVVMVIVGIALSLRRSGVRGRGMAMGIGQALAIGFFYWTTHSVSIALGRGGVLMPMLAGWMANLVFLAFGGYLILKVRY
jgi:lipopolysaccharide export system permease protein